MAINEMKALSMAEASTYVEDENISAFIKRFIKVKPAEAGKLRVELEALGNIKMKDENIAKIIDIMPEDSQDLNKIFSDVNLDENETAKILEIVKKYE